MSSHLIEYVDGSVKLSTTRICTISLLIPLLVNCYIIDLPPKGKYSKDLWNMFNHGNFHQMIMKVDYNKTNTFATARMLAKEILLVELNNITETTIISPQPTIEYVSKSPLSNEPTHHVKKRRRLDYKVYHGSSLNKLFQQLYENKKLQRSMVLIIKFNDSDSLLCSYHYTDENNSYIINSYGTKVNISYGNWCDERLLENSSNLCNSFLNKNIDVNQKALVEKYILKFDIIKQSTINRRLNIRNEFILNGKIQLKNEGARGKKKRNQDYNKKQLINIIKGNDSSSHTSSITSNNVSEEKTYYINSLKNYYEVAKKNKGSC